MRLWQNVQAFLFGCVQHALVMDTQVFQSRECFKYALVVSTQALQSRECFQHAFVVKTMRKHCVLAAITVFVLPARNLKFLLHHRNTHV